MITRKISELRNWSDNPRSIKPERFQELKNRITRFGQFKPVIITPDGEVLGGNMRLKAMKELGIEDIWVSVIEPKSEAEKIEIALTDNEEMGFYEDKQLADLIEKYKGEIELGDYSVHIGEPINLEDLIAKFAPEPEEDEAPEVDESEPPKSKLGEVYQLGRHRVMCGDSTKIEDVEKLMDGKKADMVFTDPPYNIDYEGKTKKRLKIKNDKFEGNGFYQFLLDAFINMYSSTKKGTAIYVAHADMERVNFQNALSDSGYKQKQNIIWVKDSIVLGRQDYHWRHEPILYGWKDDNGRHKWESDRKQDTVWEVKRPTRSEDHPTMKPIELCAKAIQNSTKINESVLDLFLGSGSTLIACEQTNRTCYGMELDPKYVDVIRKRYSKLISPETWEDEWLTLTPITDK